MESLWKTIGKPMENPGDSSPRSGEPKVKSGKMSDDPRFPHVRVPKFLADYLREVRTSQKRSSLLATYVATRWFAYTRSKCSDNFARCFPSVRSIGEVIGQSETTVKRNLAWFESAGLLYRSSRGWNKTKLITFVDFPERFREIREMRGREVAIREVEEELAQKARDARIQAAETRGERFRNDYGEERGRRWSTKDYANKSNDRRGGPSPAYFPPVGDPALVHERSPKNECSEESRGEEHDSGSTAPEPRSLRSETTKNFPGGTDEREEDRRNMRDGMRILKEMSAKLASEKKWPE